MVDLIIAYAIVFVSGMLRANGDALLHYKQQIIWQTFPDSRFKRWMLRGSDAREMPSFKKLERYIPRPFIEAWWDGWHWSHNFKIMLLLYGWGYFAPDNIWLLLLSGPLFMLAFGLAYEIWWDTEAGWRDFIDEL